MDRDVVRMWHRAVRREMDRLAGELLRRQEETNVCLVLFARRERLRELFCAHACCWRCIKELVR